MKSMLLFAAACVFAVPATAADDGITVRVDYADLDLTNSADVVELQGRLETALESACGLDGAVAWDDKAVAASCVDDGMFKGKKIIARHRERALGELAH